MWWNLWPAAIPSKKKKYKEEIFEDAIVFKKKKGYTWVGNIAGAFVEHLGTAKEKKMFSWSWALYESEKDSSNRLAVVYGPWSDHYIKQIQTHPRYLEYIIPWLHGNSIDPMLFGDNTPEPKTKTKTKKKETDFKLLTFELKEKGETDK